MVRLQSRKVVAVAGVCVAVALGIALHAALGLVGVLTWMVVLQALALVGLWRTGTELERSIRRVSVAIGNLAEEQAVAAKFDGLEQEVDRLHRRLGFQLEKVRVVSRRVGERSDRLESGLKAHYHQVEALLGLYRDLKPTRSLPPMRGFAVSPDLLLYLYHLVLDRRPRRIVELGSGVSTLVLAYALKGLEHDARAFSLEHDRNYREATRRMLHDHGLGNHVDVRLAPLESVTVEDQDWLWYAVDRLPDGPYDLVFVDGPPASTQAQVRYPALPLVQDRLSEDALVVLDDLVREDEQAIAARWVERYPGFSLEYIPHEKGTAVIRRA